MQEVTVPPLPVTHEVVVMLPLSSGYHDLASLCEGQNYRRTDLVCRLRIESVWDDSQELPATIEPPIDSFVGRGVYVHGPFSVRLDNDTGTFKVNTLKQAIGLTLRVVIKLWRDTPITGVTP